jgi:ethanolamine transporter EutH
VAGLSAGASFTAALVLGGLGAAAIGRGASRERRMFAAIPFLLAAQHAAEAAVWLTGGAPLLRFVAVDLFLGIAVVVWPIWLPLSLGLIERSRSRQWALGATARFGTVVATCAAALLLRWQPSAHVAGTDMIYEGLPGQSLADAILCVLAYVAVAIVPFFLSTVRGARAMGLTMAAALIAAAAVPETARTCVWCLFAFLLSGQVVRAEWRERRAGNLRAIRTSAIDVTC